MSCRILTIIVMLIGYVLPCQAQNLLIDYTNPTDAEALVVCDSASFQVSLTNATGEEASAIALTVQFPAAVFYNPGTVTLATELDVSNLNAPVFSLPNMTVDEVLSMQFLARADCELVDAINAMELFFNTISVNYNNGSNTATTAPYNIETPLLVISNATNPVLSGELGDVLSRSFTITNTRIGALNSFTFLDSHQGGIELSSNLGTDISTQNNVFELLLEGSDFSSIGDGDAFFELDESITITEEILISSCGTDSVSSFSNINASWGCNTEICQTSNNIDAYIAFEAAYLVPDLTFTPISNESTSCFCTGLPLQRGLLIENNSSNAATNISIKIDPVYPNTGIDTLSFFADSSGQISPFQITDSDSIFNFDAFCNITSSLARKAEINIPFLGVGESLSLFWDIYVCAFDCNDIRNTDWKYTYSYSNICPPIPSFSGSSTSEELAPETGSFIANTLSAPLADGSITNFEYYLHSPLLLQTGEQIEILFAIPCGLSLTPGTDLILDGQSPQNINTNTTDTINYITVTYSLPFSSDTILLPFSLSLNCNDICEELVCKDTLITSCPNFCPSDAISGLQVDINSSIQLIENCPSLCAFNTCSSVVLPLECALPLCTETIPGYAKFDFSAFRANFGLPDNNNDRLADPSGEINTDLIRRDRLMTGDTVSVEVNSIVVIDQQGLTFPHGLINLHIISNNLEMDLNGGLFENDGFSAIDQQLIIYDNSTSTYHNCNSPIPLNINTLAENNGFNFEYDISPPALSSSFCTLPSDFEYDSGDSILFKQRFRVDYNLVPMPGVTTPPIYNLSIEPQIFLLENENIPFEDWFTCNCSFESMQLTGYKYNVVSGIHAIPECENSIFVGGSLFSFYIGQGNFFPYEHRNLGFLSDWKLELPTGFSIVSSKLTMLELQGNVSLFNQVPLNPIVNNNTYQFDLNSFQAPSLDEGFSMLIQSQYTSSCLLSGAHPLTIHAEITPNPGLLLPSMIDTTVDKPGALRLLHPSLQLEATFFNDISYTNEGEWDFSIKNVPTMVASFKSGPARNAWVYPVSQTGLVTDFELRDADNNTIFPQSNGIFHLGDLDTMQVVSLQLTAKNLSCDEETIVLNYGWNCEPYNNPVSTPCLQKQSFFTLISLPAALEQTVDSPIGPHFLCDTVDYHSITIFNADLGTAYNSIIKAQLPPGLFILPGSSQIAYPTGSSFLSVSDPVDTGLGTMLWDLSALQDSINLNGLPGVLSTPNHSIQLRFQMYTNCDFIAGSYPIFFTEAEQVCGDPTNTLAEAPDPIDLDGLPPPYNTSISAQVSVPAISCQDSISVEINIIADATTLAGDSIFITLPIGVTYLNNSIVGNPNFILQEPFISINNNLQILKWPLLSGLTSGQTIVFEIMLSGFSALDCGNPIMILQTVGPASAFCTGDNSSCDILVETGSNILQLNIDRPEFSISNFEIVVYPSGNNDDVDYNITLENDGFSAAPPIIVDFYLDIDNSGTWTPSDTWLITDVFNNNLDNGSSIDLSGNFIINAEESCQIIAVIDETKHCACEGDEQIINTIVNYIIPSAITLCSAEDQFIGIDSIPGAVYQWVPETGLSCDDCSMTNINLVNADTSINTLIYTLTEDDGQGCITAYQFTINLQRPSEITNESAFICHGDSILLSATTSDSYLWSGPGILDPTLASQLVSPATDAFYNVHLVDNLGCSTFDSILVIVSTTPLAFAGNDTLFCESNIVSLQASIGAGYTYQWEPSAFLDNPSSSNPIIINNIDSTYDLTVTNAQGCQSSDQITVDFGAAPVLVGPENFDICLGDSVLIEYSGALNYLWSPAIGLSCTTCDSLYAFPSISTTYLLSASDGIGCSSTSTVNVNLLATASSSESISLCDGDSIVLFGTNIYESGIYCDTLISLFSGCDSIHCVTIELNIETNTDEEQIVCEGDFFEFNGQEYTNTGTYCSDFQTVNGCDSTHCLLLEVVTNPEIELIAEISLQVGDTIQLGPFPDSYNYSWSPSEGLSCNDCPNPLAFPTVDTEYKLMLVDYNDCSNDFNVQVRTTLPICEPPHLFIPNAFTPNGDNENDVLRVYGNGIERLHLVIFNRWGQKVFETNEIDGFWDGTFNGKNLTTDVFGYLLEVDCIGGQAFFDKGNISLLR